MQKFVIPLVLIVLAMLPVHGLDVFDQANQGTEASSPPALAVQPAASIAPAVIDNSKNEASSAPSQAAAPSQTQTTSGGDGQTYISAKNTTFDRAALTTASNAAGYKQIVLEDCTVRDSGVTTGPEGQSFVPTSLSFVPANAPTADPVAYQNPVAASAPVTSVQVTSSYYTQEQTDGKPMNSSEYAQAQAGILQGPIAIGETIENSNLDPVAMVDVWNYNGSGQAVEYSGMYLRPYLWGDGSPAINAGNDLWTKTWVMTWVRVG